MNDRTNAADYVLAGAAIDQIEASPVEYLTVELLANADRDKIDAIEAEIRRRHPDHADRMIRDAANDAEHAWRVDEARKVLHYALGTLANAVVDARRGLAMAEEAYDVEIVEGRNRIVLDHALTSIETYVAAALASVPAVGA